MGKEDHCEFKDFHYIPRPRAGISRPLFSLNDVGAIVKDGLETSRF